MNRVRCDQNRLLAVTGRLCVVLAVVLMGCVPYTRADQPGVERHDPNLDRVVFGGDSITVSSKSNIFQELADETSWWSNFVAGGGWLMSDFRHADDDVVEHPTFVPDAAVINIGTNDVDECAQAVDCGPEWAALELDDVWAPYVAAAVPCRIAVTVVYEPDGISGLNDRISFLHGTGPITHVADWKAHSAGHPEWFIDEEGHPTSAGRVAYAEFIVAELEQACPSAPTP